jgi:cell division protein FtsB
MRAARVERMRESRTPVTWMLPLGLLLFAIVFVPLRILEAEGLPRYRALRAELQQTRESNARLRREVIDLQRQVVRLRDDPEAIERIARDEIGMLRSDELVFQFQDP